METDMGCSCGYPYNLIEGKLVCSNPDHGAIAPFQPSPSYDDLVSQVNNFRKILQDICDCDDDLIELKAKARQALDNTPHKP